MATTASVWSKPGAWALDSEENESELQQLVNGDKQSKGGVGGGGETLSDFPSLAVAASTKPKKKKAQPLSLQEFSNYASARQAPSLDTVSLPTGPRERTAEELDRSRLGGGFRSYGSYNDRPARDDSRRQAPREFTPSRADETDDWGASKKFSQGNGFEKRERGGFFSDSQSRADETDDWGASKKFSHGNGFERRERGDRVGFFSDSLSRADGSDNWGANKAFIPSEGGRRGVERRGGFESNGGASDSDNWARKKEDDHPRKFSSDSESWGRNRDEGSGNSGRPRLNLKPRTIPLGEGHQNGDGSAGKPKGSNPFGEARPREEVLKEKGQDWKEIDQKLESLKMKGVGKNSFGSSNGRSSPEDSTEKSWRKLEGNDSRPEETEQSMEEYRDGDCNDAEPQQDKN
ncbi:unnamed protein product [Cuscuta epithymum]|uniref:Eukaryotic translation initiation factor 4B3-like n=1 Tax=Cuscuta epithymum TaxID=186058 RepID=A0AAV0ERY5_9ASTE|nr:unnamed protein product [Cuscuta epithymum]